MNDRTSYMRNVQVYSFALLETALYLDGHPGDDEALERFTEYNRKLEDAVEKYEANVGPLTIGGVTGENGWTWTYLPWPWEYEANLNTK